MWTPAQKRQMLRYWAKHTRLETIQRYDVQGSCLDRWKRELGNGEVVSKRKVLRIDRTARVLLEEAWTRIQAEIRDGAPVRDSDCYVKLALNSMGERK